jgi:1-phosphatidylinositol-3-phosphate 5-kinase
LLRGANTEELKKVKQVMHYTVFAAYHLILETSFFEDQRVFLNDRNASKENYFATMIGPSAVGYDTAVTSGAIPLSHDDSPALRLYHATSNIYAGGKKALSCSDVDAPVLITNSSLNELAEGANIQYSSTPLLHAGRLPPPVSEPLRKFNDKLRHQNINLPVTSMQETTDSQIEGMVQSGEEILSNGFHVGSKVEESAVPSENLDDTEDLLKQERTQDMCEKHDESSAVAEDVEYSGKENVYNKDQVDDALDSHSILILMSSQCITKQGTGDQSHLSRIKYYGNFDVSLGRYLQEILQSQVIAVHNI